MSNCMADGMRTSSRLPPPPPPHPGYVRVWVTRVLRAQGAKSLPNQPAHQKLVKKPDTYLAR